MKPLTILIGVVALAGLLFLSNVGYGAKVTTTVTNDAGVVVSKVTEQGSSSEGDVSTHYADFAGDMLSVTSHYEGNGAFTVKFLRNYGTIHSNLSYFIQVSDLLVVKDVSDLRIMAPRDYGCKGDENPTICAPFEPYEPCPSDDSFKDVDADGDGDIDSDDTDLINVSHRDDCLGYGPCTMYELVPTSNFCESSLTYYKFDSGMLGGQKQIFVKVDLYRPNLEDAKIQLLGFDPNHANDYADVVGEDDSGNPSTEFEDQFDKISAKNPSLKDQLRPIFNDLRVANDYVDNIDILDVATTEELEAAAIISPMLSTHGMSNGLAILARIPHMHFVDEGNQEWTLNEINRWLFEKDTLLDLLPTPTP